MELWIVAAAVLTAFATGWQMVLAMLMSIHGMEDFLPEFNKLSSEAAAEHVKAIPRWRVLKRRRRSKRLFRELEDVLTRDEKRRHRMYDHQGTGWSMLLVGSVVAAFVACAGYIAAVSESVGA
jgi:hypothetical protein